MSLGEKLYLVMLGVLFVSFIVLFGTLCWLDARDEKMKRKAAIATQRTQATARAASPPQTALHSS